jgi:hypothetical protein
MTTAVPTKLGRMLSVDETLLGTLVRFDSQPTEGPQLSLGTEPMRCLHQKVISTAVKLLSSNNLLRRSITSVTCRRASNRH